MKKQKHHITPRCLLKHKDKSFVDRPENIVELTHEEHVKAHQWLAMLTGDMGCWFAYYGMKSGKWCLSGADNPMYGVKVWEGRSHSKETKIKMSNSAKKYIKTPEHCKAISESKKGKTMGSDNHRYGVEVNQETRDKMSKVKKGITGKDHPRYGVEVNQETRDNIFNANRVTNWCINGEIFGSSRKAGISLGVSMSTIQRWCKSSKKPNCYKEAI